MRQTTDARVAHWFGVISDILHDPLTELPHQLICQELYAMFDINIVTWQWRTPDGTSDFTAYPATFHFPRSLRLEMVKHLGRHPLVRWFAASQDPSAQTTTRVPPVLATRQHYDLARQILRPFGCEEQLSIPYRLAGREHLALVMGRTGGDFSDADLDVARRLQAALVALDRQAQLLARFMPASTAEVASSIELTGRELAVLRLLAEGHTAFGIGRRLSMSPRTAQKHLENVYRKLGVHDRLAAVRVAERLRLVVVDPSAAHTQSQSTTRNLLSQADEARSGR